MRKVSQGEVLTQYAIGSDKFDWEKWKSIDADKPIIAGHSLGGSAAVGSSCACFSQVVLQASQLACSSAAVIDYRAVVVFDPAVQRVCFLSLTMFVLNVMSVGLEPWKSPLPHPLLVVNSEEFTVGREYTIFSEQIAHTVTTEMQVYSIGGATHPSFSDVFLILPNAINKMTGLKCSASSVINRAVRATEQFLSGPEGHGGKVTYDEEFKDEEDRQRKMKLRGAHAKDKKRNEEEGEEKGGKLYRPVGKPGELAWHRL